MNAHVLEVQLTENNGNVMLVLLRWYWRTHVLPILCFFNFRWYVFEILFYSEEVIQNRWEEFII